MGAQRAAQHPTPESGPQHPRGPALPRPQAQRRWLTHPTLLCSRRTWWTEGWSSTCCLWGAGGQPTAAGPRSRPTRSCAPSTLEQGCPRPCQSRREPWKGAAAGTRVLSGSTASPQVPSGPQHCVPTSAPGGRGAPPEKGPRHHPPACLPGRAPWGPSRLALLTTQTASQRRPGLSRRRGGEPWARLQDRQGQRAQMRPWAVAVETVGRPEASGTGNGAVLGRPVFRPNVWGRTSGRVRLGSVGARGRFCPRPLLRSGAVTQAAAGSRLSGLIRGLLLRAVTLHKAPVGLSLTFLLWLLVHDELVVKI